MDIMEAKILAQEQGKRNKLKVEKPAVYEKVMKYVDKVENGESIAILQFQYDYRCNFACEHCSADKFMVKSARARKADTRRKFDIEAVRELSRQGDEMGLAHIVITGGEPMTYPDFDQVIEAIDPTKWYISSDTNGWFLDEARAHHLKAIGVDKIQVSLDSMNADEHDAFRHKKGAHARVLRAIKASKAAGLNVIIQTVVWKDRAKSQEFEEFLKWGAEQDVGIYASFAKPVGSWEGQLDQICGDEEIDYIHSLGCKYNVFTHLTPSYGLDIGCIAVKRMVSVTQYGDIMPCPYTHLSLGNFFDEPLKDIINRGLELKQFSFDDKKGCFMGNTDDDFIEKYLPKMQGKNVPYVPWTEVFTAEDFRDGKLH